MHRIRKITAVFLSVLLGVELVSIGANAADPERRLDAFVLGFPDAETAAPAASSADPGTEHAGVSTGESASAAAFAYPADVTVPVSAQRIARMFLPPRPAPVVVEPEPEPEPEEIVEPVEPEPVVVWSTDDIRYISTLVRPDEPTAYIFKDEIRQTFFTLRPGDAWKQWTLVSAEEGRFSFTNGGQQYYVEIP